MLRKTLLIACLMAAGTGYAQTAQTDIGKFQIRVGRPFITRGPVSNMLDNPLNTIKLNNGQFRVYSSGGTTYRFQGIDSWGATAGQAYPVLGPVANSYASCGLWLNDTSRVPGSTVSYYGFAHAETECNYANGGQTFKSTALVQSDNEGGTWRLSGQILSGGAPVAGTQSGEGDCTAATDNYYVYLYCLRTSDFNLIAARAPIDNPIPGNWYKFKDGAWSQPGLGGDASPLRYTDSLRSPIGFGSASVSKWTSKNYVTLVNNESSGSTRGGVYISFSDNFVDFSRVPQPILVTDGAEWIRTAASGDLIAYPSGIGLNGGREWDGGFLLTYTFLEPGEDFQRRFLVFREVYVLQGGQVGAQDPQVGIELTKWVAEGTVPRGIRTTTAPVQGNYTQYAYDGKLGYVMSASLPGTIALEECVSYWTGTADHLVTWDGTCAGAGYRRLRTIGWIYTSPQPNTVAIYRCWSPSYYKSHYVSTDAACEGRGDQEFLLGWVLAS